MYLDHVSGVFVLVFGFLYHSQLVNDTDGNTEYRIQNKVSGLRLLLLCELALGCIFIYLNMNLFHLF